MALNKRDALVGTFILVGVIGLVWLIMVFGEMPGFIKAMGHHELSIYFPQAPGIDQNADVRFCGYSVGRVQRVDPPTLVEGLGDPCTSSYQVCVVVFIADTQAIPVNIRPTVHRRGLGGSYIELELPGGVSDPSVPLLAGDMHMAGSVSTASEFLPAPMQDKLDELLGSLARLSTAMERQFTPVAAASDEPNSPTATLTSAIGKMDALLTSMNAVLGDAHTQQQLAHGLGSFGDLADQMQVTLTAFERLAVRTQASVDRADAAMDAFTGAAVSVDHLSDRWVATADELSGILSDIQAMTDSIEAGNGTAGKLLNDPRLYNELSDTVSQLRPLIVDMRALVQHWQHNGILSTMD